MDGERTMNAKRVIRSVLTTALVMLLAFGCAGTKKTAETSKEAPAWYFDKIVDADYVAQFAKLPPPPDVYIIDVREKKEYDEGHIFSSFNIPAGRPDEMTRLLPKKKGIELIFYCDGPSCEPNHKAAREAKKLGYQNAKVFAGGIDEWKKKYELVALGKQAIAEGFGIVDYSYVRDKVANGIRRFDKVVIIDARPERMYSDGHVPSAISLPSMTFARDYPEFKKLKISKDTEIILGVGRECPLSLKNAQRLKAEGYTNLKLYIQPPIWFATDYAEIGIKKAKSLKDAGVAFLDARPERLFQKGTIEGAINIPDNKFEELKDRLPTDKTKPVVSFCQGYACEKSHVLARKMMAIGYANVMVYAGGFPEWQQTFKQAAAKIKKGSEEGTIDIQHFEKTLKDNPGSIHIIDVRSPAEFSTGSFKTATNITVDDLEKKIQSLPSDKPIVFICATGARSGEAYYMVKDKRPALKEVYFLDAEVTFNRDGSYKIKGPQ